MSYLESILSPDSVITAIDSGLLFPESAAAMQAKYCSAIDQFVCLIEEADSSATLLEAIRSQSLSAHERMTLLKLFRRCVSGVCDTEKTKKIRAVSTKSLVSAYGHTFKPIEVLKSQFQSLSPELCVGLSLLLGEYDTRGQSGYELTAMFFNWFQNTFGATFTIEGPVGAGRDVELSSRVEDFNESCPCDFLICKKGSSEVLVVGFARYDSTRGGAQSDDRTGGNANKVDKLRNFSRRTGKTIRLFFLADGPGLSPRDTWKEACLLDDAWEGNVRVATMKLCPNRLTSEWIIDDIH